MKLPFFMAHSTVADGNLSFLYSPQEVVRENRQHFLSQHNLKLNECVAMRTEHGTTIQVVDKNQQGLGMTNLASAIIADALMTNEKDVVLFLLTADCLPLVVYDPKNMALALAHLSRGNTTQKFVTKLIHAFMAQFHSQLADLHIYIGPGIHQDSYVLNTEINKSALSDLTWQPFLKTLNDGNTAIDLIGYTVQQLVKTGITVENIAINSHDTFTSSQYFSHRRSDVKKEPESRFATIVRLSKNMGSLLL